MCHFKALMNNVRMQAEADRRQNLVDDLATRETRLNASFKGDISEAEPSRYIHSVPIDNLDHISLMNKIYHRVRYTLYLQHLFFYFFLLKNATQKQYIFHLVLFNF